MSAQTEFVDSVLIAMQSILTDDQLYTLQNTIIMKLHCYELLVRTTEIAIIDNTPDKILNRFLDTKRLEGKSDSTLVRYHDICYMMIHTLNKPLSQIDATDLRYYLASYQKQRHVSNRTLDGIRRCLSSFFSWMAAEEIIGRNPCAAISQIKYTKVIKKPFSGPEMEKLKQACTNIRDTALIEFLYASGCRVSEVVRLNRTDINFQSGSAIVLGKGGKERTIYLTSVALMHLQSYLETRTDNNPCLFASLNTPNNRLSKAGIEAALKVIGKKAGVKNVHPHRFRRTLATNMINRGAHMQDVAAILGHSDLKTTQVYCYISQQNVQAAYRQYAA